MKKFPILVLLTLLTLSSCNFFGQPGNSGNSNIQDNLQNVTKTGILRSKNISLDKPGTHQLELADGSVIFLESKIIALSNYLDQYVSVAGVQREEKGVLLLEVASVSLGINNQNNNAALPGMLQYSGDLGISFRYPSLFEITDSSTVKVTLVLMDETLRVDKKNIPLVTIQIIGPTTKNLKDWIKNTLQKESVTIQAGDQIGERLVNKENNDVAIYVAQDNLYEIRFTSPGGRDENLVKNKFYEMLDTINWGGAANLNANFNTNQNGSPLPASNINSNNNKYYTGEVPTTSDFKTRVVAYLNQNLNDLKPSDDAITGSVAATKFEFAGPNYVYVEYTDNTNKRKLLLKYYEEAGAVKVSQIGYFVAGETKDWEIQSGSNDAANLPREIYSPAGVKTGDVAEGMRLYENTTLKYGIQYPSSWYYSGTAPQEAGAIHQVNFGDKPLDANPGRISLLVFKGTLASLGLTAGTSYSGDSVVFSVEKDGRVYKIISGKDLEDTVEKMGQTIAAF